MKIKDIHINENILLLDILKFYCRDVDAVPYDKAMEFFNEWNGKIPPKLIRQCIYAGIHFGICYPGYIRVVTDDTDGPAVGKREDLRFETRSWAEFMDSIKKANINDKGETWKDLTVEMLVHLLKLEIKELWEQIEIYERDKAASLPRARIMFEAGDVANIASFLYPKMTTDVISYRREIEKRTAR